MISKDDSIRLHMDWWGKCRTCSYWTGTDKVDDAGIYYPRWNLGICNNSKSELYGQETCTEGYCPQWDSFDIDTALELMQGDEEEN